MSEINYKDLKKSLKELEGKGFPSVFLIHGEEYLCKTVFNTILDALVPLSQRNFAYEVADEDTESMPDIIERLNTFSMMAGLKVVGLPDSRIFYSRQDQDVLFKKIKTHWDKGERKKAATMFGNLLSQLQIEPDDVLSEKSRTELKYDDCFDDNGVFLTELAAFFKENGITPKKKEDPLKLLKDAIDKGFPKNHHLVVFTDTVDKRKSLYASFRDTGLVVDCSVPKGDRKADRDAQDLVLREVMKAVLLESGKTIEPAAYASLVEMTGFDIRSFTSSLEKLIAFTGNRETVTVEDAKKLVLRSRQDPVYELTGAIAERDLSKALFHNSTLLADGVYPLQIIAAISNQLRRLLVARSFLESIPEGRRFNNIDFNSFKSSIMPMIREYDSRNQKRLEEKEGLLAVPMEDHDDSGLSAKKTKKVKKVKTDTDLVLAKNPNNLYPVYLLLVNSRKYSVNELYSAMEMTYKADMRLKSSGEVPRLILDDLILHICRNAS